MHLLSILASAAAVSAVALPSHDTTNLHARSPYSYQYSNGGVSILGWAVKQVGQTFEQVATSCSSTGSSGYGCFVDWFQNAVSAAMNNLAPYGGERSFSAYAGGNGPSVLTLYTGSGYCDGAQNLNTGSPYIVEPALVQLSCQNACGVSGFAPGGLQNIINDFLYVNMQGGFNYFAFTIAEGTTAGSPVYMRCTLDMSNSVSDTSVCPAYIWGGRGCGV